MARQKAIARGLLASEIAIPVGSAVNELTMTVKLPKSTAASGEMESKEALPNIQPGELIEIRSDDLGYLRVARSRSSSKGKKVTRTKPASAILRYVSATEKRHLPSLQLQAELKWPGGGHLYLLPPKASPTNHPGVGEISFSDLPPAKSFQIAADGTLEMLVRGGFSPAEVSDLVIPKRTLARRQANKEPLTVEETDKALRLARIAEQAIKVFGDKEKAHQWLRKPKRSLKGDAPLTYLGSETGARVVEDMLLRIDSGILA